MLERTGVRVSWESLRRYDSEGEGREPREPPLDVISALAALDPLQRGAGWLAFGESGELRSRDSVDPTPQPSGKPRKVAALPHEKPTDGEGRRGA